MKKLTLCLLALVLAGCGGPPQRVPLNTITEAEARCYYAGGVGHVKVTWSDGATADVTAVCKDNSYIYFKAGDK